MQTLLKTKENLCTTYYVYLFNHKTGENFLYVISNFYAK